MPVHSGAYPESRVLRSRTKTGESTEWRYTDPSHIASREKVLGSLDLNWMSRLKWRILQTTRFRARSTRIRFFCIVILTVMLYLSGYMRFQRVVKDFLSGRDETIGVHISESGSTSSEGTITYHPSATPTSVVTSSLPSRPWKYPLVDRTVLDKLDSMQDFFAQEYGPFHPPSTEPQRNPSSASQLRWPPLITRIPEPSRPLIGIGGSGGDRPQNSFNGNDAPSAAICESAAHPRPCRFLLPLRIAEQESKARMHITQLAVLARRLNRTLVLPNVGKSKIGACFKWPFSVYYDAASIDGAGESTEGVDRGTDSYVDLESFHAWMENHNKVRRDTLKSQLVSIAPTLPSSGLRNQTIYANQDVSAYAYSTFGAWERDLPGCFSSKFQQLRLETRPVFLSATFPSKTDGRSKPIGDSIVDLLSSISPGSPREPPVLVVNWDMRYPIFPQPNTQSLRYSEQMYILSKRYAPTPPYLVVQWRMETVNVQLLHECAHALVDVLVRILHDRALSEDITTVWFASDYPYPVARRSKSGSRAPVIAAKSGTFRNFDILHEDAIEILREAFDQRGELNEWKLTDIAGHLEDYTKPPNDFLHDPGVLGILDKLVSTEANIFISGSSRCSRRSSFTKQVVDERHRSWGRRGQSHLRNVVDIFG